MDIDKLTLPGISPVCVEILDMLSKEDANIRQIAKAVALDPVLSGNLIKYANSPMYRRPKPITNTNAAVNLLGIKNVTAALMMATMRSFAKNSTEIDEAIWQHGVSISTLSKTIAMKYDRSIADEMELIAMLHDMGALVFSTNFPDDYATLYESAFSKHVPLDLLEEETMGFGRDDIMEKVADKFRLPDSSREILLNYHKDHSDIYSNERTPALILSLAHHLEQYVVPDIEPIPETNVLELADLKLALGFVDQDIENIIEDCKDLLTTKYQF